MTLSRENLFCRHTCRALLVAAFLAFALGIPGATAQDLPLTETLTMSDVHPLDPARDVAAPLLERDVHKPLPEEYIWTASKTLPNDRLVYTLLVFFYDSETH